MATWFSGRFVCDMIQWSVSCGIRMGIIYQKISEKQIQFSLDQGSFPRKSKIKIETRKWMKDTGLFSACMLINDSEKGFTWKIASLR